MRRLIVYWLMSVAGIVVAMSAASAHAAPTDAPAFTRYVADRLHRSVPEVGFVVKADLALEARAVDDRAGASLISLARLYDFCERRRASCDDAVEQFLASAAEVMRARTKPADGRKPFRKTTFPIRGHAT